MLLKKAPTPMNYTLNTTKESKALNTIKNFWPFMAGEKKTLILAAITFIINALTNLAAPLIVGHVVDTYFIAHNMTGVLVAGAVLLAIFGVGLITNYIQTRLMGGVGQRVLFTLRTTVFEKIQSLPVAFFNDNKAGDLISRINNDTDKLNQFFSQALMQFIGNAFVMTGAAIFLLSLNFTLGISTLAPAIILLIITQILSSYIKEKNAGNLKSIGGMSGEIQESLTNFKVIVAFNRRDYFRKRFEEVNRANYHTAIDAGIANNAFTPIYVLASNCAQLIVLVVGFSLIMKGSVTLGLVISFLSYLNNFYNPLRQLASFWSNFQSALAAWDRIAAILSLTSNMHPTNSNSLGDGTLMTFTSVTFGYGEKIVLHNVHLTLEPGKTYALVGPTGGGKTTTASLMARLMDPASGRITLKGKDIRSYTDKERTENIGFILQDPFLFSGTVRDNIIYGNTRLEGVSTETLLEMITSHHLGQLLERFDKGLDTEVKAGADTISLGQKQLIAFMRAVLREPALLILDEATANIDTVTEQILDEILGTLPSSTTRVIIAHRLSTIKNADEIYFVSGGTLTQAGSFDHALEMVLHTASAS